MLRRRAMRAGLAGLARRNLSSTGLSTAPFMPARLRGFDRPTVFGEFTGLALNVQAVNLGQGFPDWETPAFVQAAAERAIRENHNQYTRAAGHPMLVRALAEAYGPLLGPRTVDPLAEVCVTVGASGALYSAIQALVEPGDEVVLLEPSYDLYSPAVQVAGARAVRVPLRRRREARPPDDDSAASPLAIGDAFHLDVDELEAAVTPRTRALLLNTPHNPTGKIFSASELESIAAIVRKHPRLVVLTDEVYEWMVYPDATGRTTPLPRFAALPGMWDQTVTISSAGKTFSNTGWKIGWCVGPSPLIAPIQIMNQWIQYCVTTPFQVATAYALKEATQPYQGHKDYYAWLSHQYHGKRSILATGLAAAGLRPVLPDAGFFIMAETSKFTVPSKYLAETTPAKPAMTRDWAFARWLTLEAKVACIPPSAFFAPESEGLAANFLRFAFCKQDESLHEGMRRLRAWSERQR